MSEFGIDHLHLIGPACMMEEISNSGMAQAVWPMSAYGTKQTFQLESFMSAFGGKADIRIASRNVCF
jgi:hypothetical protein